MLSKKIKLQKLYEPKKIFYEKIMKFLHNCIYYLYDSSIYNKIRNSFERQNPQICIN